MDSLNILISLGESDKLPTHDLFVKGRKFCSKGEGDTSYTFVFKSNYNNDTLIF